MELSQYYENWRGDYSSQIVNAEFFVSDEGRTDPLAEFSAFQDLILAYAQSGEHEETICLFPARMILFKQHDRLPLEWRDPSCPDFEEQIRPGSIESVSLVFASGYFDSPSSYYGHVLLKFNYEGSPDTPRALDSSLNYGADITDNPASLFYIANGLFGGYKASYTRNDHFLHTYLYTNVQLRDTWEYELNLTDEQVQFLVAYSWEILSAQFRYYFFNDNCAHRIADLIEVTTGRDLSDTHGFWLLPIQVVRNLRTAGGPEPLVTGEIYNPSLKSVFSARYGSADADQKKKFIEYFELNEQDKGQALVEAAPELLQLFLDYLDLEVAKQMLFAEDEVSIHALQGQRALILSEMFRRPAKDIAARAEKISLPRSPIEMKPPSVIRAGGGVRDGRGFQSYSYRVANNDLLDRPSPGQEASRFIMFELGIEVDGGSADLRKLVIFDLVNINTNPLPSRMTHEGSWSLTLDYAPRNLLCTDCSNFGLEGRLGRSIRPSAQLLFYGFAGARVHTRDSDTANYFQLSSEIGSVINPTEKSALELSAEVYVDPASGDATWHAGIDFALTLTPHAEFRVSYERNRREQVVLATLAYYFD